MDEYVPDLYEEAKKHPDLVKSEPASVAIEMKSLNPQMRSNTASSLNHARCSSSQRQYRPSIGFFIKDSEVRKTNSPAAMNKHSVKDSISESVTELNALSDYYPAFSRKRTDDQGNDNLKRNHD